VNVQDITASSTGRKLHSGAAVLDVQHLSDQTFGDVELERDILALFREQCGKLVPVILGNCQLPSRLDAAHTLKGGARAVGAVEVARIADEVETALRRHGELVGGQSEALSTSIVAIRQAIDDRLVPA
jgi:HPt (histidine-containing phosphotransfer) domain-containing protein